MGTNIDMSLLGAATKKVTAPAKKKKKKAVAPAKKTTVKKITAAKKTVVKAGFFSMPIIIAMVGAGGFVAYKMLFRKRA